MNRDFELDIMKGIGIILMIVGHLTPYITDFIFSFHMPLFFIISGYLYKQTSIRAALKKDFKRLIIPYILTCSIIIVYYTIVSIVTKSDHISKWIIATLYGGSGAKDIPMIGAIWFLLALFWCKNTYNFLSNKVMDKNKLLTLSIIISILSIIIHKKLFQLPLSIDQGLSALFLYSVGVKIKEIGGFNHINKPLTYILIVLWGISVNHPDLLLMVSCTYHILPFDMFGAIGGTIATYHISKFISSIPYIPKIFAFIGINSLAFLCIHLIDLDAPTSWILGITQEFRVIYNIALCFVTLFIFSKISFIRNIYNIKL